RLARDPVERLHCARSDLVASTPKVGVVHPEEVVPEVVRERRLRVCLLLDQLGTEVVLQEGFPAVNAGRRELPARRRWRAGGTLFVAAPSAGPSLCLRGLAGHRPSSGLVPFFLLDPKSV